MTDLSELEALVGRATPGPWNHLGYCGQDGVIRGPQQKPIARLSSGVTSTETGHQCFHNAALIVAAVNALPHLLSTIRSQEAALVELRGLCDRLKLEAQMHAQEARAQRSTVIEGYQAISGATGEPGDWNGAQPVHAIVAERDALRAALVEAREALIAAEDFHQRGILDMHADEIQRVHDLRRGALSKLEGGE